jgi:hypothetical protein
VEANMNVGTRTPTRTDFQIDHNFTWLSARNKPNLTISNQILSGEKVSPIVEADIENPSYTAIGRVDITALIYDTDGNALAASKTFIDGIDRQGKSHVVFTWPMPLKKDVSRIEIIPIIR